MPWNTRFGYASTEKSTFCARADGADIRFADGQVDLHLAEILCDREEGRRLEARGNRLSDRRGTRDNGAVHGRCDNGLSEILLRRRDVGLLDRNCGLRGGCGCGLLRGRRARGSRGDQLCRALIDGRGGLAHARRRGKLGLAHTDGCALQGALRGNEVRIVGIELTLRDVALREQ